MAGEKYLCFAVETTVTSIEAKTFAISRVAVTDASSSKMFSKQCSTSAPEEGAKKTATLVEVWQELITWVNGTVGEGEVPVMVCYDGFNVGFSLLLHFIGKDQFPSSWRYADPWLHETEKLNPSLAGIADECGLKGFSASSRAALDKAFKMRTTHNNTIEKNPSPYYLMTIDEVAQSNLNGLPAKNADFSKTKMAGIVDDLVLKAIEDAQKAASEAAKEEEVVVKEPEDDGKIELKMPKASVKRIMKLSEDISKVSNEAVVAVAKATEIFLAQVVEQSHQVCKKKKRKTIKVDDLILVIQKNKIQLEFLTAAFGPPK